MRTRPSWGIYTARLAIAPLILALRVASAQCVVGEGYVPDILRSGDVRLSAIALPDRPIDSVWSARHPGFDSRSSRGQLVAVERADRLDPRLLGADSQAVIMRWGTGGEMDGCDVVPAGDTLAIGTRHVFTGTLRADSLWIDGRPTIDVRADQFGDLSALGTAGSPPFNDYEQLLEALPSRTEWETDCRPGVDRVHRWLDAHLETARFPPFSTLQAILRPTCERSLALHALRLERWHAAEPIPESLHDVFTRQGCRDDSAVFAGLQSAVNGSFIASGAPQWAFLCTGREDWRLLVAVLTSPPQVIELARMKGKDWDWFAGTAPIEYFDWTSSRDFDVGRWGLPRPKRGVVLLRFVLGEQEQTLAFFDTPGGWVHAGVRCCRWSRADTTLNFGVLKRDLTADRAPEVLSLTATGKAIDSLDVTFEIRSSDRVLYTITWPMTRMMGPERNQRLSDAELRTHLREYGGWFFGKSKFMTPDGFVAMLRESARLHIAEIPRLIARQRQGQRQADSLDLSEANAIWKEMQSAGVTVFQFSTGGDAVWAIAWSPGDKRFYRIFECC